MSIQLVLPAVWRGAVAVVPIGLIGLQTLQLASSYELIAGTDFGIALLVIAALLIVNAVYVWLGVPAHLDPAVKSPGP
jgi:hypothetical protein